jgi:hypothetical protein
MGNPAVRSPGGGPDAAGWPGGGPPAPPIRCPRADAPEMLMAMTGAGGSAPLGDQCVMISPTVTTPRRTSVSMDEGSLTRARCEAGPEPPGHRVRGGRATR